MKKANKEKRLKMVQTLKFLKSLEPHFSPEDDEEIKIYRNSRFMEMQRYEQICHVIPLHRIKFLPNSKEFDEIYKLVMTQYQA